MKTIDMEEAFATMPELPTRFEEYCYNQIQRAPIYYKRKGKTAECLCGICGMGFSTNEIPMRKGIAKCPICGGTGVWEWMRCTIPKYTEEDIILIQCTTDRNLVVREFRIEGRYRQDESAQRKMTEWRRRFLRLGDAYEFSLQYRYNKTAKAYMHMWNAGKGCIYLDETQLYPGWKKEIESSEFRYFNPQEILRSNTTIGIVKALVTFANNPALEMYAKSGMDKLVDHLLSKDGKTKIVNRRAKTVKSQLRLKDNMQVKKLIKKKGDTRFLEVLLYEKKYKFQWTPEQEEFVCDMCHHAQKDNMNVCLTYMSVQKLTNRIKRYQGEYKHERSAVSHYADYLNMRRDLGYDMTNEVFLFPNSLKEKHDQMVKETNAVKDKAYEAKKNREYPKIKDDYEKWDKLYHYEDDEYVIRPAKDAAEIVREGRTLHHCVGGDNYLSKHNSGRTTILFLRRVREPEQPYYTIEIKENEILQWYGKNDKKPDEEIIGPWLEAYMERLKSVRKAGKEMELMQYETYREYKETLDRELEKTAEGFVRIGYLLRLAEETNILEESGYKSVNEFAKAEYNLDSSQVSRFININKRFAKDGYSDQLMEQYRGFGYAKLALMLTLPESVNEIITPSYSKSEILEMKTEIDKEKKITDLEVLAEGEAEGQQGSGILYKALHQLGLEKPDLYRRLHVTMQRRKDAKGIRDILAPTGEGIETLRIRGTGRIMIAFKEAEASVVNVRNNTRESFSYAEVTETLEELLCLDISSKEV